MLVIKPEYVEAHNAIANIYLDQGEEEKALESLTASINLAPTAAAYNQRGQAYATLNRHQEAVDDFTESLALRRDSPYVYLARANSLKALGEIEAARADEAKARSFIRTLVPAQAAATETIPARTRPRQMERPKIPRIWSSKLRAERRLSQGSVSFTSLLPFGLLVSQARGAREANGVTP